MVNVGGGKRGSEAQGARGALLRVSLRLVDDPALGRGFDAAFFHCGLEFGVGHFFGEEDLGFSGGPVQVEGDQHFVGVIGFAVDTDLTEADVVTAGLAGVVDGAPLGVVFDGMF